MARKKKSLTEIVCVLDRSGSMGSIVDDAIGGFNTFLESQKKIDTDDARMTIVLFDDKYEVICTSVPVQDVEPLTTSTYVPRGTTALNDAIGKSIATLSEDISKRKKSMVPEKVIFVILTDGQENSSKEYSLTQVKEKIEKIKTDKNWEFIFLSSDVDAFTQGAGYGINNTSKFATGGKGTINAYHATSSAVSCYRSVGAACNMPKEIK